MEIVAPMVSDDGIVFYVSASGKQTGISQRGLIRLIGYETTSGNPFGKSKLLSDMRDGVFREDIPKCLKTSWGKVFCQSLKGKDGALIIDSEAAVAIIEYFAFEKDNQIAKESFRKFAKKGFDTWVKEVVNFATEPTLNSQLLEALKLLNEKLDSVAAKVSKWDKIEGVTATVYPGMKAMNDSLSVADMSKLLPTNELFTVREWLTIKGVVVDKSTLYSFARQAADTYKTMTGNRPLVKTSTSKTTGKGQRNGNGYRVVDFTILETAWQTFVSKTLTITP